MSRDVMSVPLTSKAVIMKNKKIIGSIIIKSKPRPKDSADAVMEAALAEAGISGGDIAYCIGTGYGRDRIDFVDEVVSEISCHGKGARWLLPTAQTVIDIGGQDCKTMKIDTDGNVSRFMTNDKCASGTGRFSGSQGQRPRGQHGRTGQAVKTIPFPGNPGLHLHGLGPGRCDQIHQFRGSH